MQQLLEVLRIKAETFVLVRDHLTCMLETGVGVEGGREMEQYSADRNL